MKNKSTSLSKSVIAILVLMISAISIHWMEKKPALKPGRWRAAINRPDGQQIVFNFETKDKAGKPVLYIINGSERLLVDSIGFSGDSLFIQMPFFESGFRVKLNGENELEGTWVKSYGEVIQRLPFKARYNTIERFATTAIATANITGRWSAHFKGKNDKVSTLTAEFTQDGAHLTGTFLDPTGDYRFLEGVVDGDSLKLSGFDGGHAFLFTAKVDDGNTISSGKFYSGAKGLQDWSAEKNANAAIPDGNDAANINLAAGKLNFSFPSITGGGNVSIKDKQYANKVVVIQILGSWCPNCMDETSFLSDYYNANKQRGVEVIGLTYERTTDLEKSRKAVQSFSKRFDVKYPILLTGVAVSDTLRAEKTLPQLKKIAAFPTTLFVNKRGEIAKVHIGYNGPATGKHYEEYKKEFEETITKLLAEK